MKATHPHPQAFYLYFYFLYKYIVFSKGFIEL